MLHTFISTVDTAMLSLYGDEKNGENIGIIVENKHINGLEINLECVIIIRSALHRALISTLGNKR